MEKKRLLDEFIDGIKEGYQEEDKKIDLQKKSGKHGGFSEGAARGSVEGISNPIRWIGSFFD